MPRQPQPKQTARTMSTRSRPADPSPSSPLHSVSVTAHQLSQPASASTSAPTQGSEVIQRISRLEGTVDQLHQLLTQLTARPQQDPSPAAPGLLGRVSTLENLMGTMNERLSTLLHQSEHHQSIMAATDSQHHPHPPSITIPPPNPREEPLSLYDGNIVWEEYQVHLEVTSRANRWDVQTIRDRLANSLRGPALSVLADLNTQERLDYSSLVRALAGHFGRTRLQPNYRIQLKTRKQQSNETLSDLANDIERLVRGAYPDELRVQRDQKAVEVFIDALSSRDLAKLIMLSKPPNLQHAVATALQLEAVAPSSASTKVEQSRCYNCNGLGHYKSHCPKRSRPNQEN